MKLAINLAVAEVALMAVDNFPRTGSAIMTQTIDLASAGFMHTYNGATAD